MNHTHASDCSHHHHHPTSSNSSLLLIAIALNVVFVCIETFFWLSIHSLALLSDAVHNLMDVVNLIFSFVAIHLARKKASTRYTFWFKKVTILSALLNSLLLVGTSLYIIYEAIGRFSSDAIPTGMTMMIVAWAGIFVNGISGWILLAWEEKEDINIKSASLHLIGDALVSLGVVISWWLILLTGYTFIDPLISIIISVVMLVGIKNTFFQSVRLSIDGTNINIENLKKEITAITWVADIHHIHVWALSSTENALTAHIQLTKDADPKSVKAAIREELAHNDIHHSTLESCGESDCSC